MITFLYPQKKQKNTSAYADERQNPKSLGQKYQNKIVPL